MSAASSRSSSPISSRTSAAWTPSRRAGQAPSPTSESVSARRSAGIRRKKATRSSGSRASMISARSAGCSPAMRASTSGAGEPTPAAARKRVITSWGSTCSDIAVTAACGGSAISPEADAADPLGRGVDHLDRRAVPAQRLPGAWDVAQTRGD